MEEKLTTLEKYGYIYHMVGMNPITRKELREKIKKDSPKMSETTLKKYSDAPFDGAYPMFVVKDDKATLDITAFRSFIEELCKYVGTDAAVLFTGPAPAPGGRKGDNPQIAKVPNKAENPQILIERKRNTELSKQIADLEKQIEELRLENQKIVADSVLANMSKEINISTVRVFGKAVEEDIFLHNVSDVLGEVRDVSKVGGIRQSFYVKDSDKTKELTVQNVRSKVMGYITSGNQIVDAMGMMNISGNVIPQIWYSTITRPNGKPYLLAITLLSDIVYWYRPAEERDEQSGRVIGWKKRFKGDLLQKTLTEQQIISCFGYWLVFRLEYIKCVCGLFREIMDYPAVLVYLLLTALSEV